MQETSANWNPYGYEMQAEGMIEFELIDVNAAEVAQASASVSGTAFSSLPQTHDRITQNTSKLATLEPNYWALDGSFTIPKRNESNGETGWWSSALSNTARRFAYVHRLTFSFSEPQSSDGFTVVFDTQTGEVASDFTITTYADDVEIASVTVVGNEEVVRIVDLPSENYTKVELRIIKTATAQRRVRITEFVFGYLQQFKNDKIVSLKFNYETGVYMSNLPTNKLTATIDNSDAEYNVLNPQGVYKFLQQGQGINAALTLNGETVNMGRFYFKSASADDNALTATITGYDLIDRLDQTTYSGDVVDTWTVEEALTAVVNDSGLDIPLNIPAEIGARVVRGCIPSSATHREAIRLIAQAGMTCVYIDRLGKLTAKDYDWGVALDAIDEMNMTNWGKAEDIGLINNVIVKAVDEYNGTETIYTATNQMTGAPLQTLEVINPLANSQDVAEWILTFASKRNKYTIPAQSNPARDIGDCVSIANVYGTAENAVVVKQDITFNGALLDNIVAYGGGSE